MFVLTETEFKAIKRELRQKTPVKTLARTMQRSEASINRIRGSKDYAEYKDLIRSEHKANKPRVPLVVRIHNAKVEELMAIKSRGRLGAYKAVCERLAELGV